MYYRFSILTPNTPTAPCNDTLSITDYDAINLKITNKGLVIMDGIINTIAPTYTSFISNFGNELPYSMTITPSGVIRFSIDISVGDSIDLTIEVSGTGYNTYQNTFVLYHYDLGIELPLVTLNPNMDIILLSNTNNYPYSGVISYRKPFTDKIHFYKNNSSLFDAITLYDESDDVVSNISFGTICSDEDKEFYYITSLGNEICTQNTNTVVNAIQWTPTYEVTTDCVNNCTPNCITSLSSNTITINIDYSTLDTIYIDDVEMFPYISQGITTDVIDVTGAIIFTETYVNNIMYGTTLTNFSYTSSTFSIPTSGDYIVRGCINILGYEPQGIYSGVPTSTVTYKQLCVLSAADFTSCGGDSTLGTKFVANGNAVTTWSSNGKLIDVLTSGTPVNGKYYIMLDNDVTADFSNLINQDFGLITEGMAFYSSGIAPTSWGATTCIVETFPIVTCCSNILLNGCNVYEVTQSACSTINIVNNSFGDLAYSLSLLSSTGWTVVTSSTVDALTTLPIEVNTDGVYDITITYNGVEEHFIKVIDCAIETCKLNYINSLMCCNAGKNCEPCDDCSTQDNYDFNAFSILMQTYFMLVNIVVNINYSYSTTQLSTAEVLNNLYNIDDILTQAKKYCQTCDEPCSNCE